VGDKGLFGQLDRYQTGDFIYLPVHPKLILPIIEGVGVDSPEIMLLPA